MWRHFPIDHIRDAEGFSCCHQLHRGDKLWVLGPPLCLFIQCTDKKGNKIFLIYKGIESGAVVKSYMRKGFLIYEEMRKYLVIYEEAVTVSHTYLTLQPLPSAFPYKRGTFFFFFISVCGPGHPFPHPSSLWIPLMYFSIRFKEIKRSKRFLVSF